MGNFCTLLRLGDDFCQLGLFSRLVLQEGWSAFDVVMFSLVSTEVQAWCLVHVSRASPQELLALAQALPDTRSCNTWRKTCYSQRKRYGPLDAPLWWYNTQWGGFTGIHELQIFHPDNGGDTMHRPIVGDAGYHQTRWVDGAVHFPLLDVAVREALRPKQPPPELVKALDRVYGLKRRRAEDEEDAREAKRLRLQ